MLSVAFHWDRGPFDHLPLFLKFLVNNLFSFAQRLYVTWVICCIYFIYLYDERFVFKGCFPSKCNIFFLSITSIIYMNWLYKNTESANKWGIKWQDVEYWDTIICIIILVSVIIVKFRWGASQNEPSTTVPYSKVWVFWLQ